MLEGHFISLALDPDYAKINMPVYYVWKSIRSHTATLFFTISGMVFTYLLLRDTTSPFFHNERVRKGVVRSVKLFFWGYLLHLNLYYLFKGYFSGFFFSFHVLHCLGVMLLGVILIYGLYRLVRVVPMMVLLGIAATLCFVLEPVMKTVNADHVWPFFREMLGVSKEGARFRSAFPIFPWLGYAFYGAMLGTLLRKRPHIAENPILPWYLLLTAVLFNVAPYGFLYLIDSIFVPFGWPSVMQTGYEFGRFGRVLAMISFIMLVMQHRELLRTLIRSFLSGNRFWWISGVGLLIASACIATHASPVHLFPGLTLSGLGHILLFFMLVLIAMKVVPWNFELFMKVGQYTLPVYIVHAIILYSGITGYGINHLIRKSLDPWTAIFGAVLFILFFVWMVKYIEYFQWKQLVSFFRRGKKTDTPLSGQS